VTLLKNHSQSTKIVIDLITAASEQLSSCGLQRAHFVDVALLFHQLFHLGNNSFQTDDDGFAGKLVNPGEEQGVDRNLDFSREMALIDLLDPDIRPEAIDHYIAVHTTVSIPSRFSAFADSTISPGLLALTITMH